MTWNIASLIGSTAKTPGCCRQIFNDLKLQNKMLITKLDNLEGRGRQETLVFDGIAETQGETQQDLKMKIVNCATQSLT